jgi:hypothetical protein
MSEKLAAATHGARVEDRLRLHAPHSDYEALMVDAANVIEQLRSRHAFLRDRYSEAVRTINLETDLHAHCEVSQASDV